MTDQQSLTPEQLRAELDRAEREMPGACSEAAVALSAIRRVMDTRMPAASKAHVIAVIFTTLDAWRRDGAR